MKIVILDSYGVNPGDLSWEKIEAIAEVTAYDRTPNDDVQEIIKRIGDAEIVLNNKTLIGEEVLAACPNLKYIGMLATGYNVVDTAAAKKHGVVVTNVPEYGTKAVAQFAMAMLLEICHHVGHHSDAVKAGRWENNPDWTFWDYPLMELEGKTFGVIGYGRIGQATADLARAFGMKVIAYKPGGEALGEPYVSLDELYAQSDVISLHTRLTPENEKMINAEAIAKMKDGVIILNNARGQLIDEQALADALNSGKVYAAAVDVVSKEPIEGTNPLLTAKNAIITPHIACGPFEARARILDQVEVNLRAFLDGAPINVVNP